MSLRMRKRWRSGVATAGALAMVAIFAMTPGSHAADSVTFTIGKIFRVDGNIANPNAGAAQPQPAGYVSYVTFAASQLVDGQPVDASDVHSIPGDSYVTVTVPAGATMPTTVWPSAFDSAGKPTAFRVGNSSTTEGIWHGGGFPTGSHWTTSGKWVDAAGMPTAWQGGSGGYSGNWVAPTNGEKITLIDKYYSVDIIKTFDDGSSAANRVFYTTNNPDPRGGSRQFAWKTSADGTTRGVWYAGWVSYVWEYLPPADVAAGTVPVSMSSTPDSGPQNVADPVPCVNLTAAVLAGLQSNPVTPPASASLIKSFEPGGKLCGGVKVHSTHPSSTNVVTVVNHAGEDTPAPTPTPTLTETPVATRILIDVDQCADEAGRMPVTGTTVNAPDGSAIWVSGGQSDLATTVQDNSFSLAGLLPDVEYTFTVTSGGAESSVAKVFDACRVQEVVTDTPTKQATTSPNTRSTSASVGDPVTPPITSDSAADGSTTGGGRLAHTGGEITLAALAALLLALTGLGIVVVRRRQLKH